MKFLRKKLEPFGMLVQANGSSDNLRDVDVSDLRQLFQKEQLVLLRGFAPLSDNESFTKFCEQFGEISIWPFGKVLELVEHESPKDHIFDNNYVPLHWDGMYRKQVPEYQIFRCLEAPLKGQGGRTTFSNTILALKNATEDLKKLWGQTTGTYQRQMEYYNSKTTSPIITRHPHRDFEVIRYNEPPSTTIVDFLNPPDLEFRGPSADQQARLHESLKQALYAPESFYAHEWQTGDVVIADNFSLLHGRESFVSKAPRHLQRVHVLSQPPLDNPGLESYK